MSAPATRAPRSGRRTTPPPCARPVAPLLLLLALACGAPSYRYEPGPYDAWSSRGARDEAATARLELETGDLEAGLERVEALAAERPQHLPVGFLRQELELALLEAGRPAGAVQPPEDGDARTLLSAVYRVRAEERDDAAGWVLAARVAADGEQARGFLARARELDPDCPWILYGEAFLAYRERDFVTARGLVQRALKRFGAHPPTLRLHALMLANAGDTAEGERALESWLSFATRDPLTGQAELAEARVDLAALHLLGGKPDDALALLERVDPALLDSPARLELVRAGAYDESGRPDLALQAARHAAELGPEELLPLVQEAILWRNEEGSEEAELEAWTRVLELAKERATAGEDEGSIDFGSLLYELYAGARAARLERKLEGTRP